MEQAKIGELKNRLSYYLRRVRQGETIEVLDREVPVARLVPIETVHTKNNAWIEQLVRSGLVRSGALKGVEPIQEKKIKTRKSSGVLEALLQERRSGR